MRDETCDVAVVGAGPGGSSAAHYLGLEKLDVLLLDRCTFPRDKTCGDALTPRAVEVLADMGVLDEFRRRARTVKQIEIFAPDGTSMTASFPTVAGEASYGLTLTRHAGDEIIHRRALASGARFRGGIRVTRILGHEDHVQVVGLARDGEVRIRARMTILATGANLTPLLRSSLLGRTPTMMLAVRAYLHCGSHLPERLRFHFDGVPLPAYGWLFPLSDGTVNAGAIVYPGASRRHRAARTTALAAFHSFLEAPSVRELVGPEPSPDALRGHPLRCDFLSAPTFAERTLMVGEAAGLVNPLTGEGIDYALESGRIAARHLAGMFRCGDFSRARLVEYDGLLRQHYQPLFLLCSRIRDLCLNRPVLNRLIRVGSRRADLRRLLVEVLQGTRQPAELPTAGTIFAVLAG